MVIEKTRNTIYGSIFGIVNKLILILFPFIIRTLIIKNLGEDYAGLNNLFSSIIEILSLAELGFGSAMVYCMYKPIACNNEKKVRALLMYYKNIYLFIGAIIFIVGIFLTPLIQYIIFGNTPKDVNLKLLFLIYLINSSCSYFALAYRSSILIAHQRNDLKYITHSIILVLMYIIQIFVLISSKNYYLYIIFMPIFTIITNIVTSFISKLFYPQYYPNGKISNDEKKEIKNLLKSLIGHKIGAVVLNATDNLIISSFLGLSFVAIYGNYYYIMNAVFSMVYIIAQSMTSGIANSIIINSKEYNEKLLMNLLFAFSILVGICSNCLANLYQIFMRIWVGDKLVLPYYYVILFVIYFYIRSIRYVILIFKDACGMWRADFWKPYIESLTNLIVNITLVLITKEMWGIILSSILSMIFVALPWEIHVLYKNFFKKKTTQYYINLIWFLIINIVIVFIGVILCNFIDNLFINSYINLFSKLIIIIIESIFLLYIFYSKTKYFSYWKHKFFNKINS